MPEQPTSIDEDRPSSMRDVADDTSLHLIATTSGDGLERTGDCLPFWVDEREPRILWRLRIARERITGGVERAGVEEGDPVDVIAEPADDTTGETPPG